MKIGLRYGHSINCRGARGKIDEVDGCRILYGKIKGLLEAQGHTVIDCNSNANNADSELSEGTNKANNAKVDIYITLHMNAFNGKARGVECWCYDTNSKTAISISTRICANIFKLGTPNRGVKINNGYHDLKASNMESIIVETLFCDNAEDAELFNKKTDELARAIANGIDSRVSLNISKPQKPINKEEYDMKKIVTYLGDADLFAAVLVSQKLVCPLMKVNDFKASGLKAKEVIQIGGKAGDTNRFTTMKNAAMLL